jgi:prepilin-type N-terminal cleavage/methylation domain-containing protein
MKKAFTLIEILVCLLIVSILLSLMMPVFRSSIVNAWQVNCISNLRQIHMALHMYKSDYGDYPPDPARLLVPTYVSAKSILVCPVDRDKKLKKEDPSTEIKEVYSSYAWPCLITGKTADSRQESMPEVACVMHSHTVDGDSVFLILRKNGAVDRVPLRSFLSAGSLEKL